MLQTHPQGFNFTSQNTKKYKVYIRLLGSFSTKFPSQTFWILSNMVLLYDCALKAHEDTNVELITTGDFMSRSFFLSYKSNIACFYKFVFHQRSSSKLSSES